MEVHQDFPSELFQHNKVSYDPTRDLACFWIS